MGQTAEKQRKRKSKTEKRMVNMRYPKVLLNNIDAYQNKTGFKTRTQTIIHLIQLGMDGESKQKAEKG